MKIDAVAAWLLAGRIVDLSKKIEPGKAPGPIGTIRRYDIKLFTYPPGELMHYVDMESHISTHLEAPSHFIPALHPDKTSADISEVPLEKMFGMGVLVDCKDMAAKTPLTRDVLGKVPIERGDVVLIGNSPFRGDERPHMTKESAAYLREKRIKMVGFDDSVAPEDTSIPKALETYYTHDFMLSNGILMIEQLGDLSQLREQRFLFFGFVPKMGGLESFPIRALAIEGAG